MLILWILVMVRSLQPGGEIPDDIPTSSLPGRAPQKGAFYGSFVWKRASPGWFQDRRDGDRQHLLEQQQRIPTQRPIQPRIGKQSTPEDHGLCRWEPVRGSLCGRGYSSGYTTLIPSDGGM